MELSVKLVSALEKVLPVRECPGGREYRMGSALRGEHFSFQLAYNGGDVSVLPEFTLSIQSELEPYISCREAVLMPVRLGSFRYDDNVLSRNSGLFPDLLRPAPPTWTAPMDEWRSMWFTVALPEDAKPGVYPIELSLKQLNGEMAASAVFQLEVIDAVLPKQQIERTEWFYCDCIARQYDLTMWSEPFWLMLEKFMRDQVTHGCTRILTPLFTPPLDTAVGCERPTVQLVDVARQNGEWSFGFDRLERWVKLAQACGYDKFEFAHLFTQWGAEATPKIEVMVDGKLEKLFGWHVAANSELYAGFLKALLPQLVAKLEQWGIRNQCVFHVSDEPQPKHKENYCYASQLLRSLIGDIPVTDALSSIVYVKEGLCPLPVPCINELDEFRDAGVSPLWTYYCCGPETVTTNRFVIYPGARTRVLGLQLYRYACAGFLHWGYNFWNSRLSRRKINPFESLDAGGLFPAGDAFLVYPGPDGPWSSLRHELLAQAFQDHRALMLLESIQGREKTVAMLDRLANGRLTVSDYPATTESIEQIRYAVNSRLKELIG